MAKVSLGRGLGALIGEKRTVSDSRQDGYEVDISLIRANRYQPRKGFDEASLQELADSIKEKGVIQPLLVRSIDEGLFELIAGERRLRAAKLAGLRKIPIRIREANDEDSLELALIENIQRDNLNAIDEAKAYQQLVDEFELTQEEIAQKVGKKRSTVTNMLRLLSLPEEIQTFIQKGEISSGHAKALVVLKTPKQQIDLGLRIIAEGLSVRETEKQVTEIMSPHAPAKKIKRMRRDSNVVDIEEKLQKKLGAQVTIRNKGKAGRIEIYYYSLDDFDRVIQQLGIKQEL